MNEKQNWRYYLLGVMVVAAFLVAVYPIPELTLAARYTLAVFVLAAGMWIASPAEVLTPASLIGLPYWRFLGIM